MRQIYQLWNRLGIPDLKKKNLSAFSASIAFFLFLSIVPMLMLICSILPYTPLTAENLIELVEDFVPSAMNGFLEGIVSEVYAHSVGVLGAAAVTLLWSSSKGVMALMKGLNAVDGVEERRNFFVIRTIACFYTVIMLVILILSLFLNVFGNQLVRVILHRFPALLGPASFLMNFRFILVWAILAILFTGLYTYLPDCKKRAGDQLPGAVFSAVVWSVYSWGFSMYLEYQNGYGIYGSLTIIIIVLLWLYFCMYIFLLGAYLNQMLSRRDNSPS